MKPNRSRRMRAVEDERLFRRFHCDGDLEAREQLVRRLMPLARQTAARFQRTSTSAEDVFQVAALGLLKAIDRFDPDRGIAFSSYAVPTITGEIKRHFRDTGWALHVPRGEQELVLRVTRVSERMGRELGRPPSLRELAEALGETTEALLEAREAALAHDAVSLSAPVQTGDDEPATYGEVLGQIDESFAFVEDRAAVRGAMGALSERDRLVLSLRFRHDLTQREIASRIGISQMHVSRILRRAIDTLREAVLAA